MKAEIILMIVWTSLCLCDRKQRSTVLTDESKRVVEHFDFSNFDKQEALNYIDRQRFENQIRGKRSHTKLKRDPKGVFKNTPTDENAEPYELPQTEETDLDLNPDLTNEILNNYPPEFSNPLEEGHFKPTKPTAREKYRHRRGHRLKKKRKYKLMDLDDTDNDNDNDYHNDNADKPEEIKYRRKKKKLKKKKKKKKKKRHYWDKWSEWSPCSVTCGRGRRIRWRKCIAKNCTTGELEMGEKTCQLPACNLLTKLLGL